MSNTKDNMLLETTSKSVADTHAAARTLLAQCHAPSTVLALHGELGSGKTCFVQGLGEALGIQAPMTSPTFTLINEYAGARPLYHIDLYRIQDPEELFSIGLLDYFDKPGITAIEWAERAGDLIPPNAIHVYFELLRESGHRALRAKHNSDPST